MATHTWKPSRWIPVHYDLKRSTQRERILARRLVEAKNRIEEDKKTPGLKSKPEELPTEIDHHENAYDIKFCPFLPPDAPPIFAMCAGAAIFVCRIVPGPKNDFEVLHALEDIDDSRCHPSLGIQGHQNYFTLDWTLDPVTADHLLIFSGLVPKIHVYNLTKGEYVRSLIGHTAQILELARHPALPGVFATCSDDNEVRVWNMASKFPESTCAVICLGEFGHTGTVFTIAWSKNGRYLLSGGRDNWLHLWAMPEDEELLALPIRKTNTKRVYYPHFSTADVHPDIIDCVRFHGDLILSRSAYANHIVCWRIDGFSSDDPVPEDPPVRSMPGQRTRSAFGRGFQVLFTLDGGPGNFINYHHFTIGFIPRPTVVIGDLDSPQNYLWDLQRIEEEGRTLHQRLQQGDASWVDEVGFDVYDGDPWRLIDPHQTIAQFDSTAEGKWRTKEITKTKLDTQQGGISFSPDGKWLVAVNQASRLTIWRRE